MVKSAALGMVNKLLAVRRPCRPICRIAMSLFGFGLRLADAGHKPSHDPALAITAAPKIMFLNCFLGEDGSLLFGLPLVAWKRHPFTNDCSARGVFGSHNRFFLAVSPGGEHARCKTSASSIAAEPRGQRWKVERVSPAASDCARVHIVRLGPCCSLNRSAVPRPREFKPTPTFDGALRGSRFDGERRKSGSTERNTNVAHTAESRVYAHRIRRRLLLPSPTCL